MDATRESGIARQARADGTSVPPERAWRAMASNGRIAVVPPDSVDVRAIREKLGLSQTDFAARFGFTPSSVRQWEQGRRQPQGPARILLTVIAREPRAVARALEGMRLQCGDVKSISKHYRG